MNTNERKTSSSLVKQYLLLLSPKLERISVSLAHMYRLGMEQAEMGGIQLVSASLGYTAWWTFEDTDGKHSQCSLAVDRLAQRGLIVLVANGNGYLNFKKRNFVIVSLFCTLSSV